MIYVVTFNTYANDQLESSMILCAGQSVEQCKALIHADLVHSFGSESCIPVITWHTTAESDVGEKHIGEDSPFDSERQEWVIQSTVLHT